MKGMVFDAVRKEFRGGVLAVQDLSLEIEEGEFMVLVGPSGCGKSTTLRMVAGLEETSGGRIWIGGRDVTDLPPRHRDIAMVFQSYALYAHMTVRDNIGFGLRMAGMPKAEIRQRVDTAVELLGIGDLLRRKPRQLSGGQRQRVAMGRAIVREPAAFLMDEPLSNLDAKLRVEMRGEITSLQRRVRTPTLYVTHDQTEAMTMGDRVAILRAGVLEQVGPPEELYERPANVFVASFIGSPAMNLLDATCEGDSGSCHVRVGRSRVTVPSSVVSRTKRLAEYHGRDVVMGIRPEDCLACVGPDDRPDSAIDVLVSRVESLGSEILVYFQPVEDGAKDTGGSEPRTVDTPIAARTALTARLARGCAGVEPGQTTRISIDADRLYFFDAETGAAIR
jgi:multiple sugar transport system ATP-binding protein